VRFTGSDGGAVLDASGAVLAEAATDPATVAALQAAVANGSAAMRTLPGDGRLILVCPLPIRDGKGMVALITGPMTPYLDAGVTTRLQRYVDVLGAALERGSMIEQLQWQSGRLVEQGRLLDLANDAIMVTGLEEATIRYWNRGAEALYGWTEEEALGRSSYELLQTDSAEQRDGFFAAVRATGQWHGELRQVAKDGRRLIVNSRWTLVSGADGGPDEVLKLNSDVTAEHEAMKAVLTARLEAEAARDAAETANNAKSEFLSRVSHELRTPLSAIIGFADLLTHTSELDERQRVFADSVVKAADHLLELVDEVLDLARVESREMAMSPEPVNIEDLLTGVIDMLRPQADTKEIELPTTLPALAVRHVLADRQRLKQVLVNLVSNAVKYNRRGGRVDFPITSDGDRIAIGVSDTGAGIPQEMVGRLFVPFDRLGAERTAVPGTGLGLALSKALVEAMDGEIRVDTHEGSGSTFTVVLPAADSVAKRSEEGPSEPAAAQRPYAGERTLLYVEDLVSNVRLIEGMAGLRPQVHVLPAMQGQMALELAREHHPDLILLDLHLPDIPGDEVLIRLRAEPATRDIPVVILSADATRGQIDRLLALGARDYLTKPIRLQAFLEVLDSVFGTPAEDATA
jgi:PAS domain S-box-containing protein